MSSNITQIRASKKIQSSFRTRRTRKLAATQKIQSRFRGSRSRRAVKFIKETETINNNECPICFEPMTKKNITIALPCGHKFHTSCIKKALHHNHNNKCPNCRRVITNVLLNAVETRRKRTFRNVIFRPLQLLKNLYYARTRRTRQAQDRRRIIVISALEEAVAAREAEKVIEGKIALIRSRINKSTTGRSETERNRLIAKDLLIEEKNLRAAHERVRLANEKAEALYNALPPSMQM